MTLPVVKQLGELLSGPLDAAGRMIMRPVGIGGRHRPFYLLNLVDRVHGARSLGEAVNGRVVLVTGASSGIGEALARRVGSAGGRVVLVARSADKLDALRDEIVAEGGQAHAHPCDLSDPDAVGALVDDVLAQHGGVDVLVNNAGLSIRRSLELSYDRFHDYERTIQLNYLAAVRLILGVLPGMRERCSGQIVNVSTAGVHARVPRFGAYIASKAALDALSDTLQAEVLSDGVRFTTIHMSLVRTPMIAPTRVYDRFPALTPEQAAEIVGDAIVHRPRRVGPAFGTAALLADTFSPELMDVVRHGGFRMSRDSGAARRSANRG